MTAKERKATQDLINLFTPLREEEDKAFHDLQELNATEGDGSRWCSVDANLEGIETHSTDRRTRERARALYRKYWEASAKQDLLRDFGGTLAELGFWKHEH